jgi:murein DD-endopeptidase MepM/ murein hydrolase activator NlpD
VPSPPPKGQPGGSPGEDDEGSLNPEKRIGDAETLGQILVREGFEGEAPKVATALSRLFDPKAIRGGQTYVVHTDESGEPESFEYHPSAVTRFVVSRGAAGAWVAVRVDQPVEIKTVTVAGAIDSSLYESVQAAGERSALAGLLVDMLAWDINFYTDTHPGDHWKVVVEKQYLGGQFYRYGHLLAAEYGGKTGTVRGFYWKSNRANEGHYYDEKGQALSKSLLKTPLRFVRISSKFDRHRFHPILHVEKAHLGIDYAAPVGTPVWASASGKVVECEMKRGSGNTVVIAHANGLSTRYYHLSKFARGLKAGKLVKQKEPIGFVGTTGLSTGPHLHFSVTKNGAFVDPNKVQINRDAPVPELGAYLAAIRPRVASLKALEPTALARN